MELVAEISKDTGEFNVSFIFSGEAELDEETEDKGEVKTDSSGILRGSLGSMVMPKLNSSVVSSDRSEV